MRIVIAGASGFLGRNLTDELVRRGHGVTALVRRPTSAPDESEWNPYTGLLDQALIEMADVVVNTAGSRLFGNTYSTKWRKNLIESRVTTTRVLAEAIAKADQRPAFIAGNGSSYYGDHGAEPVTEVSDSRGDALMTQVTRDWEAATDAAAEAGGRVCIIRTAPVMARGGDTMSVLRPMFRLYLGARLGNGRQFFPVVSLEDWVAAVADLVEHETASGPFNLCCPETPTNAEFTEAFARAVGRRAFVRVPAAILKLSGPVSPELTRSLNLKPAALEALGYRFRHHDVTAVLAAAGL